MIKKLFKIFLWTGIIIFTILLIAILIIRIKYPPEKLKQLAIFELETTINRKVTIGKIWFNPIKGFAINEVKIYQYAPSDTVIQDSIPFFQAQQILLNYRLLSILKRKIEIKNILVDRPQVALVQGQDRRWNFEDLIAPDTTLSGAVEADTALSETEELSFPVSLDLKKFTLNKFTFFVSIDNADTIITVQTGGISCFVNDLFIPRKSYQEIIQHARGNFNVVSDKQPWKFSLKTDSSPETIHFNTELNLDILLEMKGLKNLVGTGNLALINSEYIRRQDDIDLQKYKFPGKPLSSLSFDFTTDVQQGKFTLNQFSATLEGEPVFDLKGEISDYLNQPIINFHVEESKIDLKNLTHSFIPLLPDTLQEQLQGLSLTGIASLNGTRIYGNPLSESNEQALRFNVRFSIDNFNAGYESPKTELQQLTLKSVTSGIYNLNGIQKTDIWMNLSVDMLSMDLDTLKFAFGGIQFDLTTALDGEFMPDSVAATFGVDQFFGVPLSVVLNFKSKDRLNNYQASGNLSFNEMKLDQLPASPMNGEMGMDVNFHSQSLDQIILDLKLVTDIIELQTETEPIIISPMDIFGNLVLATDTTFQKIELNHLKAQVNNFASLLMHGDLSFSDKQQVNLVIDELKADHEKAMRFIPVQFLEGFESLSVTGSTYLTSKINIMLQDSQESTITTDGTIFTTAGIQYPDQFFTLGKLENRIGFSTDGISVKIDMQTILDSIVVVGIQDKPLRNISLRLNGHLPDLETVIIDSSNLSVPDLMTNIFLTAKIDSLSGNMQMNATSYLSLDTVEDTVKSLNMLQISGKLSQTSKLSFGGNIATLTGNLSLDNLSLKYEDLAQVDSITGDIYFTENIDIEKGTIIERPATHSFIAEAGSYYYDLLRPYYLQNREKFSHCQINKIKATDYFATNINFDMFIFNETIEIPRFSMNLYEGNMSGLVYADLHDGNLNEVEWKVKGNLSRLNSAKLIPTLKADAKGSDLNLNLELSGTGLDPASRLDVEGYFYVTKIGPRFTDNVLRSLDPRGTDKSIQDTRRLLNWGYKPRLISFEIKHGNLYPTIHLVKAKFLTKLIPLNLSGGKIELARIPVKFFLDNMMAEAE